MTQPTDDLAAQMVREMIEKPYPAVMEAIARRYMEKLFSEEELRRMFVIALYNYGWAAGANSFAADVCVDKIRAERAEKDGR